jgi:Flp pilus assembly CpaE family ATPase
MLAINNLTNEDISIIQKYLFRKKIEKHEVLYEEKTRGEKVYFLESGGLKVINRISRTGLDDEVISVIKPGGFCGEEVILGDNYLYNHSVVATENSALIVLSKPDLQKIMAESVPSATKLLLAISKNYRDAVESMNSKMGRLIGFVSAKDGSGRTTLAMSISAALVARGFKVIVIDGDLQLGDCYLHMGSACKPNIARLVQREERLIFKNIEKYLIKKNGLSLLAAPELPQESDLVSRSNLNQIVQECARNADFVILAVGSHIDEYSILLWDISDLIVFVTRSSLPEITRFKRLLTALSSLNYPPGKFLGVLNRFNHDQGAYLQEYKKMLESQWFTVANDPITLNEAMFKGRTIVDYADNSPAKKDIEAICEYLAEGKTKASEKKSGVVKWLSSFFSE